MIPILLVEWGRARPKRALIDDKLIGLWDGSRTIADAKKNEQRLVDELGTYKSILVVNYKCFLDYFDFCSNDIIYDFPLEYGSLKDGLSKISERKDELFKIWQEIRANAAEAYKKIENRGVLHEYKTVYPKYQMNVYSGRSKTKGFNIQGTNKNYNIRHHNQTYNFFVCFDWIAADARIGGILSQDEDLISSFEDSDPYTFIEQFVDGEIERDKCKLAFNEAVNSLNLNDEVLTIFPIFKVWIKQQIKNIRDHGYGESILGRRFYANNSLKGYRRAFNGILQGSVAHAMQNVVSNVERTCGDIILTEQHDSLIICTKQTRLTDDIKKVVSIMLHPFDGVLDENPSMPLRVSIGRAWCDYKPLKEYR